MRWRSTFWLVGLAAGLFLYIWGFERHQASTDEQRASQPLLAGFRTREVDSVQVQRTNAFVLQVARTNNNWLYLAPFPYRAKAPAVQELLDLAGTLNRDFLVAEASGPVPSSGTNRFGLDTPAAVLTLVQGNLRAELKLGARTLSGDQVYAQLVGAPGIYAVPARLIDALPRSPHDWRETHLLNWSSLQFDRIAVSNAARGFTLGWDRTNSAFQLLKPFQARADSDRVRRLLVNIGNVSVARFVTDSPRAELDLFGLQPPVLELGVGLGSNILATVQFGNSPTNEPGLIYARLSEHGNVVLVPRATLDELQLSFVDLRESRLLSFNPEAVDHLEVRGPETFTVRRESTNGWLIQPGGGVADGPLMREVLKDLHELRVMEFSKDFVTDFTPFGLAPPAYSWIVRGPLTNSAGAVTNTVLAQLDLGGMADNRVFARRPDESSVYAVSLGDAMKLPETSWKLRDRSIWSFSTNDVTLVTVEQEGRKLQFRRGPEGAWTLAPGSSGFIRNTFSLEETVHRLSQLRASVWTARGATNRTALGFVENGHRLTVDVKRQGKAESYSVEFGGRAPSRYTYATTQLDGEAWFFEFPLDTYFFVIRDLSITKPPLN